MTPKLLYELKPTFLTMAGVIGLMSFDNKLGQTASGALLLTGLIIFNLRLITRDSK